VFARRREHWLELSLVCDLGPSMDVWRPTLLKLARHVSALGSFRRVRLWAMDTDQRPPALTVYTPRPDWSGATAASETRRPRELLAAGGRHLILVVSDCVSRAWWDGSVAELLTCWSESGLTGILQVLPEFLWHRTALGGLDGLLVWAAEPAAPNTDLSVNDGGLMSPEERGRVRVVPVAMLSPAGVSEFVRTVTARGGNEVAGFVLHSGIAIDEVPTESGEMSDPLLAWETFARTASTAAQSLAADLAMTPVITLPVMRLLAAPAASDDTDVVPQAELWLSGMLETVAGTTDDGADADTICYSFRQGIREQLLRLQEVTPKRIREVVERVSDYLERNLIHCWGLPELRTLRALLEGRTPDIEAVEALASDKPFARISVAILRRAGLQVPRRLESTGPTDFVIITPLEEELRALLARLPGHRRLVPAKEYEHTAYQAEIFIQSSDETRFPYSIIVLCASRWAQTYVERATQDAIRRWQPRYVILVGIAGGIAKKNVKLGDVLIADQVVTDTGIEKADGSRPVVLMRHQRADPGLLFAARDFTQRNWQMMTQPKPNTDLPVVHFGPICTVSNLGVDEKKINAVLNVAMKVIGVETEAGGVAHAAFQAARTTGFFTVSGVSDLADEKKDSKLANIWRSYACEIAAAYTIELLKNGPVPAASPKRPLRTLATLEFRLGQPYEEFDEDTFVRALESEGIDVSRVRIKYIRPGSTIVGVEGDNETLSRLIGIAKQGTRFAINAEVIDVKWIHNEKEHRLSGEFDDFGIARLRNRSRGVKKRRVVMEYVMKVTQRLQSSLSFEELRGAVSRAFRSSTKSFSFVKLPQDNVPDNFPFGARRRYTWRVRVEPRGDLAKFPKLVRLISSAHPHFYAEVIRYRK
jgi:nucleoside phosphorylase